MCLNHYKNQLLYVVLNNSDFDYSHNLGLEIYKYGGSKALFTTMNLLVNELMENEYSNEYLEPLRLLELSWNNICNEWQV